MNLCRSRFPSGGPPPQAPLILLRCFAMVLFLLGILPFSTPAVTPGTKASPFLAQHQAVPSASEAGENIANAIRKAVARPSAGPSPGIYRDDETGVPIHIGRQKLEYLLRSAHKPAIGSTPLDTALNLIESHPEIFRLHDPRNELLPAGEHRDSGGRVHVRFEQVREGVPVLGCAMTMHFDADGSMYAFTGRYIPTPAALKPGEIKISAESALRLAREALAEKARIGDTEKLARILPVRTEPVPELVILPGTGPGESRPAWKVELRPNLRERWLLFPDVRTGEIIEAWQANPSQGTVVTATALDALGQERNFPVTLESGTYYLADPESNIIAYDAGGRVITSESDVVLFSSQNNTWTDSIAVSAYANLRASYEYYLQEHGRAGVDGNRMQLPVLVHYSPDGSPYFNAFWAGEFMAFGDGRPYAQALDVVAHELTHGVVQYTVGLEYRFQSGALSEAICDLMACYVDPDWLIGEDLPAGAIRNVLTPWDYGLPQTMERYQFLSIDQDNGGVHINMGIPSRAVALLSENIGREKTADILYHVLDSRYLVPRAQFSDFRLAMTLAAADLFGGDSAEAAAVAPAFEAVGITTDDTSQPPGDVPPPEGGEWIAFIYNGRLALSRPGNTDPEAFVFPINTPVFTGSASPVSICRNGIRAIFVDASNNLRSLEIATLRELLLDDSGVWSSVALSCDGSRLAATTIFADSTLFVFDLDNPDESKAIRLYTPGSELSRSYYAMFADALDWNMDGTQILFDQFNRIPVQNGNPIEFWNVNVMDVESETIVQVQLTTDRSVQTGNPSYAETTDRLIVCDLLAPEFGYNAMVTVDLFNLQITELRQNGFITVNGMTLANLGVPRYAPDDRNVIFQQISPEQNGVAVLTIPLQENRMNPAGEAILLHGGELPRWFVQAEPTGVAEGDDGVPRAFRLGLNRPNPFNPSTLIPFSLSSPAHVVLEIIDILGQRVAVLADGELPEGDHEAVFDGTRLGSGVYFSRLRAGSSVESRKMLLLK